MRARRAICVSRDAGVRQVVGSALRCAALEVDDVDTLPVPADLDDDVVAIVIDRATRQATGEALRKFAAPIIVVGDDLDDDGLITLMLETPVSHLVADPSDPDLEVTSEKLATGDLFGIEKYLTAEAAIGERVLRSEAEKRHAMDEVCAWAEATGARRPVVHRIMSVVDELLMNALRDTSDGQRRAVLRWGADDGRLAVSVGDGFGALRQRDLVDNVLRARSEGGRPRDVAMSKSGGAGLGLYLVLANVASLIVNVAPGEQTEVICLFDLSRPTTQGAITRGVRSLHVFAGD